MCAPGAQYPARPPGGASAGGRGPTAEAWVPGDTSPPRKIRSARPYSVPPKIADLPLRTQHQSSWGPCPPPKREKLRTQAMSDSLHHAGDGAPCCSPERCAVWATRAPRVLKSVANWRSWKSERCNALRTHRRFVAQKAALSGPRSAESPLKRFMWRSWKSERCNALRTPRRSVAQKGARSGLQSAESP